MMQVADMQKKDAIVLHRLGCSDHDAIEHQALPKDDTKHTTAYALETNAPWPDQGLNRIIATLDSFDTNELDEIECLEMLIYLSSRRQDARVLAENAIKTYGSLAKTIARSGKELCGILSVDHAITATLVIVKASLKFVLAADLPNRQELKSYAALIDYLALDLRHAEQEIARIIYLDAKCGIIKDEEISRGTVDNVSIYPREIVKRAANYCASSIILAHNHLSDDATPSQADIQTTLKVKRALEVFDITLHDHVIIARNCFFSMQQKNII